jgi:hypothetical protein
MLQNAEVVSICTAVQWAENEGAILSVKEMNLRNQIFA